MIRYIIRLRRLEALNRYKTTGRPATKLNTLQTTMQIRTDSLRPVIMAGLLTAFLIPACTASEHAGNGGVSPAVEIADQDISPEQLAEARSHYIRGLTARRLDDFDAAETHLTRAQSILRRSPGVNFALAGLYLDEEDYVNAIYYGNRAVELEPDNKWYRLLLVDSYRATGEVDAMMDQFEAILDQNPNDVDVLFLKARILSTQGEYEASNEAYQRILDLTGPDRSIYYQRISNFTRIDDTESIIEELNKVLDLEPGNVNTLLMLSQFYLEQDRLEEARTSLMEALERNPRHPEALVNLADIHINREEWDEASQMLNDLVSDSLVSTSHKIEIVQYVISRFSNEPENDELKRTTDSLIHKLLVSESENGMTHAIAAEYYSLAGDDEKSLEHLRETVELMPDNDAAWRQLVQTYYVEGLYDEAITTGKEADEYVPDDAFIHFFVGGAYFLKDDYEQAASWLRSASDLPSRSRFRSIIFGTLGDTYASQDKWDDAADAFEQAITLDPENDVALNNYAYYLSERGERLNQAREMAAQALELNPDNAAFLDTLGWVYFKLGEYEEAYEYIRASIETGDASAEVMEHMGDVYDKLGEPDRAMYWWQKALDKDEDRSYLKERLHIN